MKMIFFLSLLCTALSLSAEEPISCEKTYVTFNQIFLTESSLFAEVEPGIWVEPASLHVDANGFFFNNIRFDKKNPGMWKCQRKDCGKWNYGWRHSCGRCGNPKK